MRSVYYRTTINILDRMRAEGGSIEDLELTTLCDDISRVDFPETDIRTLKVDSIAYEDAWAPAVRLIDIPPGDFLSFVVQLGANDNWWMVRFWDLRSGVTRSISAGREHPSLYGILIPTLRANGRFHEWAGVEATPPGSVRVGLYRYPTGSISVKAGSENDSSYLNIRQQWENFLCSL